MNFKLGIKDDLIADCTDVKQVLEKVRGLSTKQVEKASDLSSFEIKQLTQRTGTGGALDERVAEQPESELVATVDKVKGIGFDKQHIVSTSAPRMTAKDVEQLNQIQGMNTKDLKYLDHQKKLSMINFLTEKLKRDKEEQREKEEKAAKKRERRMMEDEARRKH
jgi:hypothetical protein